MRNNMGARWVDVFIIVFIYSAFELTLYRVAGENSNGDHWYGDTKVEMVNKTDTSEEYRLDSDHERQLFGIHGVAEVVGKIRGVAQKAGPVISRFKKAFKYRKGLKPACINSQLYCCHAADGSDHNSCSTLCCLNNARKIIAANPCGPPSSRYKYVFGRWYCKY